MPFPDLKKIIIAEDDDFLSSLLNNRLQREGFAVQVAKTGDEALSLIKSVKPDLVLLDIILPGKLGFEILAEMKQDAKLSKIPFMVMSNLGQEEDIKKAKELGAIQYFVKARIMIESLVKEIQSFLASKA